jgi:teichuronic acid biosynthesis glycosyltransferase TuaG
MPRFKVDVVIPTYNSADTIVRAVNSALAQDVDGLRVLVVDDCSEDDTRAALANLAAQDKRVQPVYMQSNAGAGVARRIALQKRNSDFIAFLDADDMWMPSKLERALSVFNMDESVLIVHSGRYISNASSGVIKRDAGRSGLTPIQVFSMRNPITTSSAVVKSSAQNIEAMPDIRSRQDYIYWRQLVRKNPACTVYRIGDPLVVYQTGLQSLSSSPLRNLRNNFFAFQRAEGLWPGHAIGLVTLNAASKVWDLYARRPAALTSSEENAVREHINLMSMNGHCDS